MTYSYTPVTRGQLKVGDLVAYQNRADEFRYAVVRNVADVYHGNVADVCTEGEIWGAWEDTPEEALRNQHQAEVFYTKSTRLYILKKRMTLSRFLEEHS